MDQSSVCRDRSLTFTKAVNTYVSAINIASKTSSFVLYPFFAATAAWFVLISSFLFSR